MKAETSWTIGSIALCALLAGMAHSPLLRCGLLACDYASLLGPNGGPDLASAWQRVSLAQWGLPAVGGRAFPFRFEQLLALGVLALALRGCLARALASRIGPQAAGIAASAAALVLPLHPRASELVARLDARAELGGLLFAAISGALFLQGRQEEREGLTIASLVALAVSGLFSAVALPCALLLACAEFACVRRHRRRSLRLRTATTTAAVFGACAALTSVLGRHLAQGPSHSMDFRARVQAVGDGLAGLALPSGHGLGVLGIVLAGALLLAAAQPALVAGRHAPRLWGGIFLAWAACLGVALLWATRAEVAGDALALGVWSAGLGLAVASLGRARRLVHLWVLMTTLAALAHTTARPWLAATGVQRELRAQLLRSSPGGEEPVWLLDPPQVSGAPVLGDEYGWLLHPRLNGDTATPFLADRYRSLSSAAFLALADSEVFPELRARRPVVLWMAEPAALRASPLEPSAPQEEPSPWRHELSYSPARALDPLDWEGVRVTAGLATAKRDLERLAWRAADGSSGSVEGALVEQGLRRVATYDLSASLAWRLAGPVHTLVIEQGVRNIERGELLARLPELEGIEGPAEEGEDWTFACGGSLPSDAGGRLTLRLLALPGLELSVVPLELESHNRLRARRVKGFARGADRIDWAIDYSVGSDVLFRARGHVLRAP